MILFLIGAAITTTIVLASRDHKKVISIIFEICFVVALLVNVVLVNKEPAGLKKLNSLGYITKNGYVETLDGQYYSDGSRYYLRDDSKCAWIPFSKPEYIEVDIDTNLVVNTDKNKK